MAPIITDQESIDQAVGAFHNLSYEDATKLKELNTKIQNHTGKWGERKGGERLPNGAIKEPWIELDPLLHDFIGFMYDKDLLPIFDWHAWEEGSNLFESDNPARFDHIDVETALKLIQAAIRKERFFSGTLVWAFEAGQYTKLVQRLVELYDYKS